MKGYPDGFMEHFRNPLNVGNIDNPELEWEARSTRCQDRLRFSFRLDGNRVREVKFLARGCCVLIVSASAVTELVRNRTIPDILDIQTADILDIIGKIPDRKLPCIHFTLEALKEGLLERSTLEINR